MPPKYDKGPICSTMGEKRHVNYNVIENYKYIIKNGSQWPNLEKDLEYITLIKKLQLFFGG